MLATEDGGYRCSGIGCGQSFAVIRDVPALVPSESPVRAFRNDFDNRPTRWRRFRRWVRAWLPNIVLNVGGRAAISRFLNRLSLESAHPVILNMGEKHSGPVLTALRQMHNAQVLHADNALGRETRLLVDFSHLPIATASIDAVVIDSGLEHEVDPAAAVREAHRVLRSGGLVYVDMPFMMPVHAGPSDFQRFSGNGLRALLRDFDLIERGVSCGPAMALSQMIQYCMLSLVRRQWARIAVKLVCRFTLFWLKYLDLILARLPGAMDAAAGTYFIGRKSPRRATDAEIIAGYLGIVPSMYEPLHSLDGASHRRAVLAAPPQQHEDRPYA